MWFDFAHQPGDEGELLRELQKINYPISVLHYDFPPPAPLPLKRWDIFLFGMFLITFDTPITPSRLRTIFPLTDQ